MGVLRREVRSENFELLNHVAVRIHRSRAVATRVRNVCAVGSNVNVLSGAVRARIGGAHAVRDISSVQRTLAAAITVAVNSDNFAAVVGATLQTIAGHKAGNNFDELRRIAAYLAEILQLLRLKCDCLFA